MTIKQSSVRTARAPVRAPVRPRAEAAPGRGFRLKRPDFRFGREIYSELHKVTWPSWKQTRDLTAVVVAMSGAVGVLLGGIDFLFAKLVEIFILNPR